jgi:hypothetical protein
MPFAIEIMIMVMVMIVPVMVRMPPVAFYIPPFVGMFPAIPARGAEFQTALVRLFTVKSVMPDRFVEVTIRFHDSLLALIISSQARCPGE